MRSLTCSDSSPPEDQMAFLLSNGSLLSRLRSTQHHPQEQWALKDSIGSGHRGFHIELGAREKALLEEDPALKRFKTYKKSVWRLKRVGDVLTIVVVAGCCYEIYVRTVMKNAAVEAAKASGDQP